MEKKSERKKPTLKWAECGPDLSVFADRQHRRMLRLIRRYGEIRFRYAALLTERQFANSGRWLDVIRIALKENWMSGRCMDRLAVLRFQTPNSDEMTIPWLQTHFSCRETEADWASTVSSMAMRGIEEQCLSAIDPEYVGNDLVKRQVMKVKFRMHPDLRFDNVVLWLMYIVEGHQDPQLQSAFAKYRPDLHLTNHGAYLDAWQELIGLHRESAEALPN